MPREANKLSKAALSLLEHMRENYNFLTLSDASCVPNEIKSLKMSEYIVQGRCPDGMYKDMDGWVVVNAQYPTIVPKKVKQTS